MDLLKSNKEASLVELIRKEKENGKKANKGIKESTKRLKGIKMELTNKKLNCKESNKNKIKKRKE